MMDVRPERLLLATLLTVLTFAAPASAQQVRGTVTDLADAPLAGALLSLVDGDSLVRATTLSDSAGAFLLRAPAGDSLKLRVQRLGYAAMESLPIALQAGDSLRLEIHMRPQPVAIEGVTATGASPIRPELSRFLWRQTYGFGRVYGPDDLAQVPPMTTANLLASLPGSFLAPGAHGSIVAPGNCLKLYLDGLEVEGDPSRGPLSRGVGIPIGSVVSPTAIQGVEVYRNPAQAPPEFQRPFMPPCTIVLIWTDFSFGIGG